MHRALENCDVLSGIFMTMIEDAEEADVDFVQRLYMEARLRATLLQGALVCRQFRDPALDALWWRLDNLVPLIRLLPCFVPTRVKRKGSATGDTLYILTGEPSEEAWRTFQSYARRVRIINLPRRTTITPHIVSVLSKWNHGAPLLPAVKELTWCPASPSDTSALLLGTESLELLHIVLEGIQLSDELEWLPHHEKMKTLRQSSTRTAGDRNVEQLIKTYSERTLRLKTLEFSSPAHPLCLAPIASFTKLEHLYLRDTPIDLEFLQSLSALRGLESLTINFLPNYDVTAPSRPIQGFQHLTSLDLAARAPDMALFFETVNPLIALTSLSLEYPNGVPEMSRTYRKPLECLQSHGHATKLQSIKLDISTRWRTGEETIGDLMQPLLDLPTLERVIVHAPRSEYRVTEDDLARMARAWPRLTRLLVCWKARPFQRPGQRRDDGQGVSAPPLKALAHFAQHCPALRELVLSNIDTSEPLPDVPARVGRHRLEVLTTMDAYPIADAKMVGRYVFFLFPYVWPTAIEGQPSGWDIVLRWVEQFRVAWNKKVAAQRAAGGEK